MSSLSLHYLTLALTLLYWFTDTLFARFFLFVDDQWLLVSACCSCLMIDWLLSCSLLAFPSPPDRPPLRRSFFLCELSRLICVNLLSDQLLLLAFDWRVSVVLLVAVKTLLDWTEVSFCCCLLCSTCFSLSPFSSASWFLWYMVICLSLCTWFRLVVFSVLLTPSLCFCLLSWTISLQNNNAIYFLGCSDLVLVFPISSFVIDFSFSSLLLLLYILTVMYGSRCSVFLVLGVLVFALSLLLWLRVSVDLACSKKVNLASLISRWESIPPCA